MKIKISIKKHAVKHVIESALASGSIALLLSVASIFSLRGRLIVIVLSFIAFVGMDIAAASHREQARKYLEAEELKRQQALKEHEQAIWDGTHNPQSGYNYWSKG